MYELVQMDRVFASHDVLQGRSLAGLDKVRREQRGDHMHELFRLLFWPVRMYETKEKKRNDGKLHTMS